MSCVKLYIYIHIYHFTQRIFSVVNNTVHCPVIENSICVTIQHKWNIAYSKSVQIGYTCWYDIRALIYFDGPHAVICSREKISTYLNQTSWATRLDILCEYHIWPTVWNWTFPMRSAGSFLGHVVSSCQDNFRPHAVGSQLFYWEVGTLVEA